MAKFIVVHSVKVATDFTPETFGRLTTIGPKFRLPVGKRGMRKSFQVSQCQCGNVIMTEHSSLRTANSKSCGCLRVDHAIRNGKNSKVHGMLQAPEYSPWQSMIQRCVNANNIGYANYGGRGIRVCDRWRKPDGQGFLNFLNDMGPRPSSRHTIERNHMNLDYCPENCRWATYKEQARNKRNNTTVTYNGKSQCIAAWTEELGLKRTTISARLKSGWSVEKALTTPLRHKKINT